MRPRPTPFDLVFGGLAETDFPQIRSGLEAAGVDLLDRDAFLLRGEAGALLQQLRPDEGLGEGITELAALAHHAFLFWLAGAMTLPLDRSALATLLGNVSARTAPGDPLVPPSFYLQLPARQVWAELEPGAPPEPLDGIFVAAAHSERIRVLGIFGMHDDRSGFTVAETEGVAPVALARADGTALFAPALPGGAAARLHSIVGAEELLELGWRGLTAARRASEAAGPLERR